MAALAATDAASGNSVRYGGGRVHELLVLPLAPGTSVGKRTVRADDTVAETASLGEASSECGPDARNGVGAGLTSWLTLTLKPGRYELLCNRLGHYAAGVFTELDAM